jgi:hypothetical protein
MANKSRNEINQPRSAEDRKPDPREGESNKLNKRAEVLKATSAEQNLDTAEGRGPAFWRANRQLKETLSWPLGY